MVSEATGALFLKEWDLERILEQTLERETGVNECSPR